MLYQLLFIILTDDNINIFFCKITLLKNKVGRLLEKIITFILLMNLSKLYFMLSMFFVVSKCIDICRENQSY